MPTVNKPKRYRVEAMVEATVRLYQAADILRQMADAAEATLAAEDPSGSGEVTLLLTTDEALRELNLRFNGEDAVTDVLSFNETAGWHNGKPPAQDAGFLADTGRLGDIAISLPTAAAQAASVGSSLVHELTVLTVHGTLHLLGYDHAVPDEERAMFEKTDRIVDALLSGRRKRAAPGVAARRRPPAPRPDAR